MRRRPRLLDVCCKAGGAAMGYHRAGFDVTGVDIKPQPNYPFDFVQADALLFIRDMGWMFHAAHGSPPCHDHSTLRSLSGLNGTGGLLAEVRTAFEALGVPWVIENVPGAPMRPDVILCGSMFDLEADGYVLRRHRLFESNVPISVPGPDACVGRPAGGVHGGGGHSRADRPGIKFSADQARRAMRIGWMTRDEMSQAIPPAYTEHIGRQLIAAVTERMAS